MGLARFAVADELDAPQQAHAADVANLLEAALQLREPLGEIGAHCLASLEQFFLLDRLHDGETHRRRQRIGYMRGVEGKPALMTTILDLAGGDDTCERHAAAQRFRHGHDVRRHFQM